MSLGRATSSRTVASATRASRRRQDDHRAIRPPPEAWRDAATKHDKRGLAGGGYKQGFLGNSDNFDGRRRGIDRPWGRLRPPRRRINQRNNLVTEIGDVVRARQHLASADAGGRVTRIDDHDVAADVHAKRRPAEPGELHRFLASARCTS